MLTADIEIKLITMSFLDELCELEKKCFHLPWTKKMFEEELENKNAFFTGAFSDNKLIGYVGVIKALDEGQITNVAVSPDYRRLGIGKKLIGNLISTAKENGISFYTLEVRESNLSAINLYKSVGFYEVGKRKNYYPDNRETAILMDYSIE